MKITSARGLAAWLLVLSVTSIASIGLMKLAGVDTEIAMPAAAAITVIVLFGCAAYQRRKNL